MKILHIEDQDIFVRVVQAICGKEFVFESAGSLSRAHQILRERSDDFHILLVDLNLTDSSGLDTVRELRRYNVPMVVLTSEPTDEFLRDAAMIGAADYIEKEQVSRIDLSLRLKFVYSRAISAPPTKRKKSSLCFEGIAGLKPYLSCGVLA